MFCIAAVRICHYLCSRLDFDAGIHPGLETVYSRMGVFSSQTLCLRSVRLSFPCSRLNVCFGRTHVSVGVRVCDVCVRRILKNRYCSEIMKCKISTKRNGQQKLV